MQKLGHITLLSSLLLGTVQAAADVPKYQFLRFNEDWSVLQDQPRPGYLGLKYLPLNEQGSAWVSFGGHARYRYENWNNFGLNGANDDNFSLWRVLGHADIHFNETTRAFIEVKHAEATDRDLPGGRRTLDVDSTEIQQAFVDWTLDLGHGNVTLRGGRQELSFGKQRLVSPLPWGNSLRHWDGASLIYQAGDLKATSFYTQFAPVRRREVNNADAGNVFSGIYATYKTGAKSGIDLYGLYLDRDDNNNRRADEQRLTLGGRLWGHLADDIRFDIEAAYQLGDITPVGASDEQDISAYMIAAELEYKANALPGKPALFAGFDLASGDRDPDDNDNETFNQLFPLGHAYLGFQDFIGRQNIVAFNAGFKIKPVQRSTLRVALHSFYRQQDDDAVYNAGAGILRPANASPDTEIGQALDFTVSYAFSRHLKGLFGYSHFFTGDVIEDSAASDDSDFTYFMLLYTL